MSLQSSQGIAGDYIRVFPEDADRPEALQTATIRFVPQVEGADYHVDLIGAIHIADQSYYEALNAQFREYDALLFELVSDPAGIEEMRKKQRRRRSGSFLHMVQTMMSRSLDLTHQMLHIDYTVPNMVHADLSFGDLKRLMKGRGVTMFGIFKEVLAEMMGRARRGETPPAAMTGGVGFFDLFKAFVLGDTKARLRVKSGAAKMFGSRVAEMGLQSKSLHELIVIDRNKAALEVLKTELAKGTKKIAIFYGAAHCPDFEQRLVSEFGLKRDSIRWTTAWDLTPKKK